jgi:hypothetical protein
VAPLPFDASSLDFAQDKQHRQDKKRGSRFKKIAHACCGLFCNSEHNERAFQPMHLCIGTTEKAKHLQHRESRFSGTTRDRKLFFLCALSALSERKRAGGLVVLSMAIDTEWAQNSR